MRKINYYTYSAKAAYDACPPLVEDPDVILFSDLARAARRAVEEDARRFIDVLRATA